MFQVRSNGDLNWSKSGGIKNGRWIWDMVQQNN